MGETTVLPHILGKNSEVRIDEARATGQRTSVDRSIYHLSSLAVLAAIHDVTKDIPPFAMMIVGEFAALSQMIETESRAALSRYSSVQNTS